MITFKAGAVKENSFPFSIRDFSQFLVKMQLQIVAAFWLFSLQ